MNTLILVGILGALLVLVLMKLAKKDQPKKPAEVPAMPQVDLANLKPWDVRAGDAVSIAGAGDEMTDLDFNADRVATLAAGSRQWVEASGVYRERRISLRASHGEEDEVALANEKRKLTLEDLGLSEQDLAEMDERQNTADNFEFDGHMWSYRLSREVSARRDGEPRPSGYYYWEFREQDGSRILTARKAEGEPFAVTLFTSINPGDVTVYRASRG